LLRQLFPRTKDESNFKFLEERSTIMFIQAHDIEPAYLVQCDAIQKGNKLIGLQVSSFSWRNDLRH